VSGNWTVSTGGSYSAWIGSATGYVTQWWDQSGKGNHAAQSTTSLQPTIVLGTPNVINFSTQYFTIANQVFPTGDGSYTIVNRLGTHTYLSGTAQNFFYGAGSPGPSPLGACIGADIRTDYNPSRIESFWYGVGGLTDPFTYAANSVWSVKYTTGYGANSYLQRYNGTQTGIMTPSGPRNSTSGNQQIGGCLFTAADGRGQKYYNGTMQGFMIFNTPLGTSDLAIAESV
jgi:hypothetical protein